MISIKKTDKKVKNAISVVDKNGDIMSTFEFCMTAITNKIVPISEEINKFIEFCYEDIGSSKSESIFYDLFSSITLKSSEGIIHNINKLFPVVSKFVESQEIEDLEVVGKTSSFIPPKNVRNILKICVVLRLYCFSYATQYKLNTALHKEVLKEICFPFLDPENNELESIYNLVLKKIDQFSYSDKLMWEFLKMKVGKCSDVFAVESYELILSSILVKCEVNKNPIKYIMSTIMNKTDWLMRSVYKNTAVTTTFSTVLDEDDLCVDIVNDMVKYSCDYDVLSRMRQVVISELTERGLFTSVDSKIKRESHFVMDNLLFIVLNRGFCFDFDIYKKLSVYDRYVISLFLQFSYEKFCNKNKGNKKIRRVFSFIASIPTKRIGNREVRLSCKSIVDFCNEGICVDRFIHSKSILLDFVSSTLDAVKRFDYFNLLTRSVSKESVPEMLFDFMRFAMKDSDDYFKFCKNLLFEV